MASFPLFFAFVLAFLSSFPSTFANNNTTTSSPRLSDNVFLRVSHLENIPGPITNYSASIGAGDGFYSTINVVITYTGKEAYCDKNWQIYFHFVRRVLDVKTGLFTVRQVTGDLNVLKPTVNFTCFYENTELLIPIVTETWILSKTDFMPRWYIVDNTGEARVIKNTDTENIYDYATPITPRQFKLSPRDKNIFQTGETRFEPNSRVRLTDITGRIIPTPLSTNISENCNASLAGGVRFNVEGSALSPEQLGALASRFALFGITVYSSNISVSSPSIHNIFVSANPSPLPFSAKKSEGYTLSVRKNESRIIGYDTPGAFYGVQSLIALSTVGETKIPCVDVFDAPRYGYRGQHMDIARNFQNKETILGVLEQMAAYKMNKFLLHASDDEGWRIEIPGLPELTTIGSRRCHDPTETKCILPQLGSGPTTHNHGTGHLNIQNYKDILRYAHARNIEVIPEFDMPGHARAAVVAMENRARRGDTRYRLLDPEDTTKLGTVQNYNRLSLMNPCLPSTHAFVKKIVKEIQRAHHDVGVPLTSWSFGGDEAKNVLRGITNVSPIPTNRSQDYPIWNINSTVSDAPLYREDTYDPFKESPACARYMAVKTLADVKELMGDFANRVSRIVKDAGVTQVQSWQDGLRETNQSQLALPTLSMDWDALFWGSELENFARKGYRVIAAPSNFLYFDMPYESNPNERGYYWASRGTSLKQIFGFSPQNIPQNAETSMSRDNTSYKLDSPPLPHPMSEIVVGMQAQVWGETIRTAQQFQYMLFPRMLAAAERSWHQGGFELEYSENRTFEGGVTSFVNTTILDEEYNKFANVVGQQELAKLDLSGVFYRLPPVGTGVSGTNVTANTEIPGVEIEFSVNGGPWSNMNGIVYVGGGNVSIRTVSPLSNRTGPIETLACRSLTPNIPHGWCVSNGCTQSEVCRLVSLVSLQGQECISMTETVSDSWCAQTKCAAPYEGTVCRWA